MRQPSRPASGFTLLEVVVAIAIPSLLGIGLLRLRSEGVRRAHLAQAQMTAALLLRAELAKVSAAQQLKEGERTDRPLAGWSSRVRIEPSPVDADLEGSRFAPWLLITVDVQGAAARASVTTLRLANAP